MFVIVSKDISYLVKRYFLVFFVILNIVDDIKELKDYICWKIDFIFDIWFDLVVLVV